MVSSLRRVVLGVAVVIGVAQTAVGNSSGAGRLRARQGNGAQNKDIHGGDAFGWGDRLPQQRSLASTGPQCTMPEGNPCTLNTTAIGMLERGYATYYDEDCIGDGCNTDGMPGCTTCYLSVEIYIDAFNATEDSMPDWVMCPCCVPSTLEANHTDLEVMAFNYTSLGISESECTDPPTLAPVSGDSAVAPTMEPTVAPTPSTTPSPTKATPLSPDELPTPEPTEAPDGPNDERDVETSDDSAEGLSTGAKIGIGAGSAVGVIILGAACYGVMKATGRA